MFRYGLKTTLLTFLLISVAGTVSGYGPAARPPGGAAPAQGAAPQTTIVVPEGNDYATHVLRDPWDMTNFSDISEYLNTSDQANDLSNVVMTDGMFTAQSTGTADAHFAALFPGYATAMKLDRDGALHPILSSIYKCLYIAIDVQSATTDYMQIFWFGDDLLNGGSHWAISNAIPVQANVMSLYLYPLTDTPPTIQGLPQTPWTSLATWQGLRIDPTLLPNTIFQVDWIRLTDCTPVNATLTWSGNSQITSMSLQQVGTNHSVLVKRGIAGNLGSVTSVTLDTQGIQAGTYNVLMENSNNGFIENANQQLVVNQAPIARFLKPSATSGADYASQNGNTWDFADGSDTTQMSGMTASIHDSLLDMTTQSSPGADPQAYLNAPQPVNGTVYRYLTYRMYTDWAKPWQNVPNAMIVRWIWTIPGAPGSPCYLNSQDMPFDVGWHVYSIDLHDSFDGMPEGPSGPCPAQPPTWSTSSPILQLRFDPNENSSGLSIHQELDWIRLTAMDQVAHGTPYELQVNLNRAPNDVSAAHYYYTTDLSRPTQSPAQQVIPPTGGGGPFRIFLPLVQQPTVGQGLGDTFPSVDLSYLWDTSNVAPNTYYLCVVLTAGLNTGTYCSDVPIQVL